MNSVAVPAEKPAYWKTVASFVAVSICIAAGGRFLLQTPPYFCLTPTVPTAADMSDVSKSTIPIIVQYRSALIVPGMVLKVSNRSDRPLSLLVRLAGKRHENTQQYALDVQPLSAHVIGDGEALPFGPGDTVQITQKDFRPWESRIP